MDHLPVPVEEIEIEHDSTKHHAVLKQESLGILLLPAEQDHLGCSQLLARQLFDMLQELYFVRLSAGQHRNNSDCHHVNSDRSNTECHHGNTDITILGL